MKTPSIGCFHIAGPPGLEHYMFSTPCGYFCSLQSAKYLTRASSPCHAFFSECCTVSSQYENTLNRVLSYCGPTRTRTWEIGFGDRQFTTSLWTLCLENGVRMFQYPEMCACCTVVHISGDETCFLYLRSAIYRVRICVC